VSGDGHDSRRRAIERRTPRANRFEPHTPLGPGVEFDTIRRMLERWGPVARHVGDDAAVITTLGESAVVVSIDTSVENVHFRADWLTPREIGYRAASSALSDLAAMGAEPLGILAALAIPESWREHLDAISDGIGEAAAAADTHVLGGDMSRGTELALTFTVLGTASDVLSRSGARPDDAVFVTGRLGGALAALRDLQNGREPNPSHRERFAHPVPRIREAAWLSEQGATAAIDISDGLGADLGHLACASHARIVVEVERIPAIEGMSPLDAAASGEEYEIIVTARSHIDTDEFRQLFGLELTQIGRVEQGLAAVCFFRGDEEVEVPAGYLHFGK